MMTVRELIKLLKKEDQDAIVVWQSHDQSEDECDGYVFAVSEGSKELCENEQHESIVVLTP